MRRAKTPTCRRSACFYSNAIDDDQLEEDSKEDDKDCTIVARLLKSHGVTLRLVFTTCMDRPSCRKLYLLLDGRMNDVCVTWLLHASRLIPVLIVRAWPNSSARRVYHASRADASR